MVKKEFNSFEILFVKIIKVLLLLACLLLLNSSAKADSWDDFSNLDRIWDGQKTITNQEFEQVLDKLEENLKRQQSKFENFADDMICENLLTIAEMRRVIDKYAFAYMYATESLVYGLSANHNDIDYIVRFLGRCVRLIKSQTNIPQDTYNRIVKADKLIRQSNLFHIIGKSYTQTYSEFMSKVIVRNEYSYDMDPDED